MEDQSQLIFPIAMKRINPEHIWFSRNSGLQQQNCSMVGGKLKYWFHSGLLAGSVVQQRQHRWMNVRFVNSYLIEGGDGKSSVEQRINLVVSLPGWSSLDQQPVNAVHGELKISGTVDGMCNSNKKFTGTARPFFPMQIFALKRILPVCVVLMVFRLFRGELGKSRQIEYRVF